MRDEGNLWTVTTPCRGDSYEYKHVVIDENDPNLETNTVAVATTAPSPFTFLSDEIVPVEVDSWDPTRAPCRPAAQPRRRGEGGGVHELLHECVRLRTEQACSTDPRTRSCCRRSPTCLGPALPAPGRAREGKFKNSTAPRVAAAAGSRRRILGRVRVLASAEALEEAAKLRSGPPAARPRGEDDGGSKPTATGRWATTATADGDGVAADLDARRRRRPRRDRGDDSERSRRPRPPRVYRHTTRARRASARASELLYIQLTARASELRIPLRGARSRPGLCCRSKVTSVVRVDRSLRLSDSIAPPSPGENRVIFGADPSVVQPRDLPFGICRFADECFSSQ